MMLSFSKRILKANTVTIDLENKVVINNAFLINPDTEESEEPENPEVTVQNILDRAQRQAAKIVQNADKEAEKIINEATLKGRQAEKSIKEKAYSEAYQEGMNQAAAEGNKIKSQAQKVLEEARAERISMQESLEPEIVELIGSIVDKLLNSSALIDPSVILNLIRQGMAGATITDAVTIRVSKHDYEITAENKEALMALTDGSVKMDIIRDLSLNPMDCVIETPFGSIDCSLGQQFESLKNNLAHILNSK